MEVERRHRPRRARRPSGPSSQQRQPAATTLTDHMPDLALAPESKATIARSKSRYKGARPNPSRSISTPLVPPIPAVSTSLNGPGSKGRTRPNTTFEAYGRNSPATDDEDEPLINLVQGRNGVRSPEHSVPSSRAAPGLAPTSSSAEPRGGSLEKPSEDATHRKYLMDVPNQLQKLEASQAHGCVSRHAEAERGTSGQTHTVSEKDQRRIVLPARPLMAPKKSFTQRIAGLVNPLQSAEEAKAHLKLMISHPIAIDNANLAPVEQFDAPKSAVNAGERMVRVKYKEFQVPVTIVPSTTPGDVIRSVSEKVSIPIQSDSTVILECFRQLGLERPLRRYEHIRDVMNSWDSDSQNTLIIEPSTAAAHGDDLDVNNVPRTQPVDSFFHLYHSQRPGHWDKREITLRSDGQMLIDKSRGAEASNICHLSDFDIYIPTARQIAKKIRPPKRICFAVKSQQKSNMFMSTVNFVHFFCSNDKRLAKTLYTAIQEWRSWYLVNVMGKGVEKSRQAPGSAKRVLAEPNRGPPTGNQRRRAQVSQSAQAAPLASSSIAGNMQFQQAQSPILPTSHSLRRNDTRKDSDQRQAPLTVSPYSSSAGVPAADPLPDRSLRDRAYKERQRAQHGNETRQTAAPAQQSAASSISLHSPANELKRSSSQMKKPKPLVDLTPQYQEPPQHSKKGKGVTPGQIPVGGLVDIATSPEVAIHIPPTSSWRRPGTSSGPELSPPKDRLQP